MQVRRLHSAPNNDTGTPAQSTHPSQLCKPAGVPGRSVLTSIRLVQTSAVPVCQYLQRTKRSTIEWLGRQKTLHYLNKFSRMRPDERVVSALDNNKFRAIDPIVKHFCVVHRHGAIIRACNNESRAFDFRQVVPAVKSNRFFPCGYHQIWILACDYASQLLAAFAIDLRQALRKNEVCKPFHAEDVNQKWRKVAFEFFAKSRHVECIGAGEHKPTALLGWSRANC